MKKIMILLIMLLTFFVLPRVTVNGALIEEDSQAFWGSYNFGYKSFNDYTVEPVGLGFDFTSYDNFSYIGFFNQVSMISFGASNSSGNFNYGSSTFRQLLIELIYFSDTDNLQISLYGDKFGNTQFDNLGSAVLTDISEELGFFLIGFDVSSSTDNSTVYEDRSITFRIGSQSVRIPITSSSYTALAMQQSFDVSSIYDPSIQFFYDFSFRDYYRTNVVNAFGGDDDIDVYIGNVASVNSSIFDVVLNVAYEAGFNQGAIDGRDEVDGLLSIAQLVIGVVVNMVLFIATLEVYNISILSIFTTLILIIGVVWIMKAIRG